MSFIDKVVGFGKQALGFISGDSIGGTLARTALLGYALNRVAKSIAKANQPKDMGNQLTVEPDTEYSVPVLYGTGYVEGKITDAILADNNRDMWVCMTLCEVTGNLINGTASEISFEELYIDGMRIGFRADGYTVSDIWDDSGNNSTQWDGLIEVYPFNNGSANPTGFTTESANNTANAYDLMPNWSSTDTMDELVFCIIKYRYNSTQQAKLTSIGTSVKFKLSNSMTLPGDCLNDYMQNTRYGAGIPAAEIDIQ